MHTSQFVVLSILIAASAAAAVWTGPRAYHLLGYNVQETGEVQAARRTHLDEYNRIRATLPELSQEPEHSTQAAVSEAPTSVPYLLSPEFEDLKKWTLAGYHMLLENLALMTGNQPNYAWTTHRPTQAPPIVSQAPPVVTEAPPVVTAAPIARWTGPFANHVLGQDVKETPEVAAARRIHEDVYSKVRAILPELPEEVEAPARVVRQVNFGSGSTTPTTVVRQVVQAANEKLNEARGAISETFS